MELDMAEGDRSVEDLIKQSLDKIRPQLQADGGDVQFVEWNSGTGVVKVALTGMCATCPMAQVTLKQGIEQEIKQAVPEVKEVTAA